MATSKTIFAIICFGLGVAFAIGTVNELNSRYSNNVAWFTAMVSGMLLLGSFLLLRRKSQPTGQKIAADQSSNQNPFRALNPDGFDRGAKINRRADELRRLAASGDLTETDVMVALQTALGHEIAATTLRRNPTFSPDQMLYVLDQLLDAVGPGVREAAYMAANLPAVQPHDEERDLTEEEFKGLTNRILNAATKNNMPVGDALSATAKALGVLISIVAERPNVSAQDPIKFSQNAVAEFARDALNFRASQSNR